MLQYLRAPLSSYWLSAVKRWSNRLICVKIKVFLSNRLFVELKLTH